LLKLLENIDWIQQVDSTFEITCPDIEPEVIYIQLIKPNGTSGVISFDEIITTLDGTDNPLTNRFVKSLEKWKGDVNKKP